MHCQHVALQIICMNSCSLEKTHLLLSLSGFSSFVCVGVHVNKHSCGHLPAPGMEVHANVHGANNPQT